MRWLCMWFILSLIIKFSLDYIDMIQDKLSKHDNKFENTKFKTFFGFGVPEILMNIMSCHGFSKSSISTVILTYQSALVNISKIFVIVETK